MRRVVMWALVGILALLMPSSLAAPAPQMDASDEPVVEGPLSLADTKCDRKKRTSGDQTVAVIKRCLRFYTFDPASESDMGSDYGIVWLQSNVKAKSGWCAKRTASDVLLPDMVAIHSYNPKGPTPIEKAQPITTRVVADAGGTATAEGRITQDWLAYPAKVRGLTRADGRIFRVKWTGTSRQKLAFAGGVEIAWQTDTPPDGLSYRLNFALGSPDTC